MRKKCADERDRTNVDKAFMEKIGRGSDANMHGKRHRCTDVRDDSSKET
jgi:hypothetical protein